MRVVGGGGGGSVPDALELRERLVLDGMVIALLPVAWRCRRSAAAWGMKAWPSRLKGRTNGSTCVALAYVDIHIEYMTLKENALLFSSRYVTQPCAQNENP